MLKRYIITIFLTTVGLLGSVAAFNAVVDPFAMDLLVDIKGFNDFKPELNDRVRLLKAYELRRLKPDSVILGNSRVHIGFNTSNIGWAQQAKVRYNLAFDSGSTKEMYYYLLHANAIHPLKVVILGLDLFHIDNLPAKTTPDFDTGILMSNGRIFSQIKLFLADLKILTSLDTFKSSIVTIRSQRSKYNIHWFSPDGHRIGPLYFNRTGSRFNKFGPRYLFDSADRGETLINKPSEKSKTVPKLAYHERSPEGQQDNLTAVDYVRKIIGFCRDHDIDLKIMFTPSHAHKYEIEIKDRGWQRMEYALRSIVQAVEDDTLSHPDKAPIPIYDFSLYSSITQEPLPSPENKIGMNYYWECSHFKENVGDLMLDVMFPYQGSQAKAPKDFYVLLTKTNVDAVIAQMHIQHELYKNQHSEELERIWKSAANPNKMDAAVD